MEQVRIIEAIRNGILTAVRAKATVSIGIFSNTFQWQATCCLKVGVKKNIMVSKMQGCSSAPECEPYTRGGNVGKAQGKGQYIPL